ncbi:hypothetical protein EHQ30_06520 [Leptospira brenneri]|uniref:Uncharacterized protein n=2 Tax=Leptospira brenneri TaxID=2023182 RepID=A0A5F1Z9I1_9LEPT|nr:hypothetical protein EHQ30_06520 [Leptospira brenneri]
MKFLKTLLLGILICLTPLFAEDDILKKINDLKYQTGTISIGNKLATVRVPKGFKFLDAKQSQV